MSRRGSYVIVILVAGLSGACASSGATPQPFPMPHAAPAAPGSAAPGPAPSNPGPTPRPSTASPASPSGTGYEITGTALGLRGTPYRNGGADPSGFDCSGFVQYVFAQHGVKVPRKVTDQFHAGKNVPESQLEPGDLVFFTTVAPGASHVGIALGGDEFVHAPSSAGDVRVEHLSASYWAARFVGARRVI
jgi:cell wall-associated NlpC family hydrolase